MFFVGPILSHVRVQKMIHRLIAITIIVQIPTIIIFYIFIQPIKTLLYTTPTNLQIL